MVILLAILSGIVFYFISYRAALASIKGRFWPVLYFAGIVSYEIFNRDAPWRTFGIIVFSIYGSICWVRYWRLKERKSEISHSL